MKRRLFLAGVPIGALAGTLAFPGSGHSQAVPPAQVAFREILRRYARRAQQETNALAFSDLENERSVELERALDGFVFTGWRWRVAEISKAASDLAFVAFNDPAMTDYRALAPSFSAVVAESTPIYSRLKLAKIGEDVAVSGRFRPNDRGGFRFTSATSSRQPLGVERGWFLLPGFAIEIASIV